MPVHSDHILGDRSRLGPGECRGEQDRKGILARGFDLLEAIIDELAVIVPFYNAERFALGALATIRGNAAPGRQFILIDDDSDDRTADIINDSLPDMPYVTFLRNEQNSGVAASRNRALDHVDARYLTFLDADDWMKPGHLTQLVDAISHYKTDMVRTDYVRAAGLARKVVSAPQEVRNEVLDAHRGIGAPGAPAMVDYPFLWAGIYDTTRIPAELLRFDESLRTAADRPWFWKLHLHCENFVVTDLNGYFYRKDANADALTQTGKESALHFIDAYDRVLDAVFEYGDEAFILKAVNDAMRLTVRHIRQRSRYTPELQTELLARASRLFARVPEDALGVVAGANGWGLSTRILVKRLFRSGKAQA